MLVGYARTSTAEQEAGLEAQIRDLKAAGCERIFSERVSSVGARPQWEEAKRFEFPHRHYVDYSQKLYDEKQRMLVAAGGAHA